EPPHGRDVAPIEKSSSGGEPREPQKHLGDPRGRSFVDRGRPEVRVPQCPTRPARIWRRAKLCVQQIDILNLVGVCELSDHSPPKRREKGGCRGQSDQAAPASRRARLSRVEVRPVLDEWRLRTWTAWPRESGSEDSQRKAH